MTGWISPTTVLALPALAFVLLALISPLRHRGRLAGGLVIAASAASLLVAIRLLMLRHGMPVGSEPDLALVNWLPLGGEGLVQIGWRLDGVSAPMLVVVGLVALCVQVYSLGYLDDEPGPALGRYYTWQALFVVVMQALVLAPNMLQLFMGWELVGLCSYLLIGFWWRKPEASRAAVKAFWVTKFADGGLLLGLVVLAATTGNFDWNPAGLGEGHRVAITLLLFAGVVGKSAQVPLHIWLPDAMQGPTPVSALLHAATMVAAGVYMIVRAWPLFEAAPPTLEIMCWVGAVTAFSAACLAVIQDDVKKMLAFSTCSQLGYMVAALGAGGMAAGYFHLTTHAFFKALLFLCAGSVIHAVGTNSMRAMGGLARKMPITAGLFTLGALALAGIPPFAGFYSKDMVLEALHHHHAWGPLLLCLATVGLTAAYMGRAVLRIFAGPASEASAHAHEAPVVMSGPKLVLGVLTVVTGIGFSTSFQQLLGGEVIAFAVTPLGVAGLVLALAGLGVATWQHRGGSAKALEPLAAWLASRPVDRLFESAYRQLLLVLAAVVAWLDRYVVDALINVAGWATMRAADGARRMQTGRADHYVWAVAAGAVVLLFFSTWAGAQ